MPRAMSPGLSQNLQVATVSFRGSFTPRTSSSKVLLCTMISISPSFKDVPPWALSTKIASSSCFPPSLFSPCSHLLSLNLRPQALASPSSETQIVIMGLIRFFTNRSSSCELYSAIFAGRTCTLEIFIILHVKEDSAENELRNLQ